MVLSSVNLLILAFTAWCGGVSFTLMTQRTIEEGVDAFAVAAAVLTLALGVATLYLILGGGGL